MTISTEYTPPQYIGNSSTTIFSFPYTFYSSSDLTVTRTQISTGVDTTLALTTDYTVSGGSGSSGSITCVVAPTSDQQITIERSIPYKQDADFAENTAFPAETLETVLDKTVIMAQQTKAVVARALVIPASDSGVTTALPTATVRAGKALFFDGTGNPDVTTDTDTVSAAAAAASASLAQAAQTAAEAAQAAAEAASAGIRWRPSVKAATTANITLSAPQTIDGVSCIAGDRVLVKDQSAPAENGIYLVAAGVWTRATDADSWDELVSQAVSVDQGATLADTQWICSSDPGGTLGVSAVIWASFLTTPRDSSVTYAKIDPNIIATVSDITGGTASKIINAANLSNFYKSTKVYQSAGLSISTATWTTITFDSELWDDGSWHSTSVNTDRITFDFTGRVHVSASYGTGSTTSANHGLRIRKNGTTTVLRSFTSTVSSSGEVFQVPLSDELNVTSGDYITMEVYQNTAGARTTDSGIAGTTLCARRIR